MGNNMNRLGDILAGQMKRTARANMQTSLELGTINGDMSLTTDGIDGRIGKDDYMVDIRLTQNSYETGDAACDGEYHKHKLPSAFRKLRAGDRVLVAWVGNDPIVVAIVVSGNTTTK